MLSELRFVKGAVSKKEFLPAMTHFAIEAGMVRAYNGSLALCAPINFNIDCKPKALPLIDAINACTKNDPDEGEQPIQLAMTPTGRLRITSGDFKAFIECINEDTPHVQPEGERVDFDGAAMFEAIKAVEPFIGDDASRPWCNGVLMRGESAFATNNVVAVQYWTGANMPIEINVPRTAIAEMLRINEPPTYAQVTTNSITFHYLDKRWVRTQLLDVKWPDMDKLFAQAQPEHAIAMDPRLFLGLEKIKKFTDKSGRVFIEKGILRTAPKDDVDEGARFEIPGFVPEGIYQIDMLLMLKNIAQHADFSPYPSPAFFYGGRLRGAIVGMRM